jgi:hypothetical protein
MTLRTELTSHGYNLTRSARTLITSVVAHIAIHVNCWHILQLFVSTRLGEFDYDVVPFVDLQAPRLAGFDSGSRSL